MLTLKNPTGACFRCYGTGIMLAGSGALLKGLDRLISEETGIPVFIAEQPIDCVVLGTGKVLEELDTLSNVLLSSKRRD